MKRPSVFIRILQNAPHPTAKGHRLFVGERYNVGLEAADTLVAGGFADVEPDNFSAPGVKKPAELLERLQGLRVAYLNSLEPETVGDEIMGPESPFDEAAAELVTEEE